MVPKVEGSKCELDYPPRSVCYRKEESIKRNSTHIDVKMAVKLWSFLEKLQKQKTIVSVDITTNRIKSRYFFD